MRSGKVTEVYVDFGSSGKCLVNPILRLFIYHGSSNPFFWS